MGLRKSDVDDPSASSATTLIASRYTSAIITGVTLDTGASKKCTAGLGQFQALPNADLTVPLGTSSRGQGNTSFHIGTLRPLEPRRSVLLQARYGFILFVRIPLLPPLGRYR